jgi:hypothetical protein
VLFLRDRQTSVGVLIMMRSLSPAFFITQRSLNSSDRAKFLIPLRKSASKKKPAGTARVIIEMHQLFCFAKIVNKPATETGIDSFGARVKDTAVS